MTLDKVEVVLFRTETDTPVRDFLDSMPPKLYRKAFWTLEVVQQFGRAGSQYFKALKGTRGLYEVRIKARGHSLRLLGFFAPGDRFVLVHGFEKKTEETPEQEIRLAILRRDGYLSALGKQA